ncbi:MAG: hypothetical protein FP826_10745 [Sphingomonadales bacterium]|nr:hypothetical protein [Sphingomonadales bacterium]MBU3993197.1 hypothetical protein [Alphaproteobacteria bacterium]
MFATYEVIFLCVGVIGLACAVAMSFIDPAKGCGVLAATLVILLGAGVIWFGLLGFLTGFSGLSTFG